VKLLQKAMAECTNNTGKVNFLIDGFPRNQNNWEGWMTIFGKEAEMPIMLFFECPWEVQEVRILKRAKYSGRSDDNPESLKKRFLTYKEETMPIIQTFLDAGKCVQVDTSKDRQAVYNLVREKLGVWTDSKLAEKPLTERCEMLLGLRPYPKREPKVEEKPNTADKKEWPELVGQSGEDAVAKIKEERPDLAEVASMPDDAMMTMDFREDRVRVMVNGEGKVSSPPRCG
jgi:hypothetical protein